MTAQDDANYRLRLARGFFDEASQDLSLQRWRSCVDNAQLSAENSGKAVLAIFGPVPRTHNPAPLLRKLLDDQKLAPSLQDEVERVLPLFEQLGLEQHFSTDYGLESEYVDPWALYGHQDAANALDIARQCLQLAERILAFYQQK